MALISRASLVSCIFGLMRESGEIGNIFAHTTFVLLLDDASVGQDVSYQGPILK
jgi:hypothetical protein